MLLNSAHIHYKRTTIQIVSTSYLQRKMYNIIAVYSLRSEKCVVQTLWISRHLIKKLCCKIQASLCGRNLFNLWSLRDLKPLLFAKKYLKASQQFSCFDQFSSGINLGVYCDSMTISKLITVSYFFHKTTS